MSDIVPGLTTPIPPAPTAEELDAHWARCQTRLSSALAEYVPPGSTVVYLDYPIHGNTGDQMLMLGTEAWFKQSRFDVVGRWHIDNFRFPAIPHGAIILCHAGGNMGDLYRYQRHREAVVRAYPDHRILFLPQTIFYRDPSRLRRSAEILRRHDDLHLFVRDRRSHELAAREFQTTTLSLVPDIASFLYPISGRLDVHTDPEHEKTELLYLMRRDWEWTDVTPVPGRTGMLGLPDVLTFINPSRRRSPVTTEGHSPAVCLDWYETAPVHSYAAWSALAAAFFLGRLLNAKRFHSRWQQLANSMVIRGARRIRRARCLVTNRLHAHLLACMVGTPSILLDNCYGKCSAYYNTWHSELRCSRFANQGIVKPGELFSRIASSRADYAEASGETAHED